MAQEKLAPFVCTPYLYHVLTDFQNYFTVRIGRKFVMILSRKIPPHLKCVATLPCEMSNVFLKSWFLSACQEWERLASSSSNREPRLTANVIVNMFSVALYYQTSVQDALQRYSWTLQQGSAPSHTSRNTVTYLRREYVTFIETDMWRPNSPDLNPLHYAV